MLFLIMSCVGGMAGRCRDGMQERVKKLNDEMGKCQAQTRARDFGSVLQNGTVHSVLSKITAWGRCICITMRIEVTEMTVAMPMKQHSRMATVGQPPNTATRL
jgi:hypothetical protein